MLYHKCSIFVQSSKKALQLLLGKLLQENG